MRIFDSMRRHTKFLRVWGATLAFAVLLLPTLGSGDPMARFDKMGHQLMCSCSCGQILLECNHVGCPLSEGMRSELHAGVDSGKPDKLIYASFISKYGPTVMAAPVFEGFNILAWIMPIAALLFGTLGVALLLSMWKQRLARQGPPMQQPLPVTEEVRARIRRETEQ